MNRAPTPHVKNHPSLPAPVPDPTVTTDRRGFLKKLGLTGAGLCLSGLPEAVGAEPTANAPTELPLIGEAPPPPHPSLSLWYRRPARRWLEALPVGNGRLGAMVFGGAARERLALNETTLWSGAPSDAHDNPGAREALPQVRQMLLAGRYVDPIPLIEQKLLGRELNYGSNLPGGDLYLDQAGLGAEVRDYRRELDLDPGIARVAFVAGGVRYDREVFASHPDGVLAIRFHASRPGALTFSLRYDGGKLPCTTSAQQPATLQISGHAFGPHSDGRCGVVFHIMITVRATGGTGTTAQERIEVRDADSAVILVAFNTDYQGRDPVALCSQQITAAAAKNWRRLSRAHQADHQALFRRVSLDLGRASAAEQPTDARLIALRRGAPDPQLAALLFQYGRYLTIAGSRADSPLPMHLQGIWNDNLACNMGWTCDFHLDINTQQNYWATETCNLSECGWPLFRLVESLTAPGRRTAQRTYGIDQGWVCHVFTNAWGFTAIGWGRGWSLHVMGGVWIATHLWEHYAFTGDREFLAQHAYPVLKGAAEFFLAYLTPDPATGQLLTGPSDSPENSFVLPGGGTASESMGPTHDRALLYELFSECIQASTILNLDDAFRTRLEQARAKLPPYQVGKHGQLQEWREDFENAQPNHRHTSHLVGLNPLAQITPRGTPDLAKAAAVTLERRMGRKDWEDVEWSRANAINYYARLFDGERAETSVNELLRKLCGENLLTVSVAGIAGAADDIFVVDGNTAASAGIAEMLLQSHTGEIELLPALPKTWASGSVKGLRARAGFEVSLRWEAGQLRHAEIRSLLGNECALRYGEKVAKHRWPAGSARVFDGQLQVK